MDVRAIALPECLVTAMLTLLGCGVVANVLLPNTKGNGGGWLLINFGWGLAVFAGVYVAYSSGGHINPAVTLGLWLTGQDFFSPAEGQEQLAVIEANPPNALVYIGSQIPGGTLGAAVGYLAYKQHL